MLVSIVIPAYRTEKYVEEAIRSALGQDYPQKEIILVDDGSPDRCPEIFAEYAARYDIIRVCHQENQGSGIARDTGLLAAKGEYVFFLDSDDRLDGFGAISCLAQKAEETGADIVVGNYRKIQDGKILDVNRHHLKEGEYTGTANFRFEGFYRYGHLAYNWGKLYKRAFLIDNDLMIRAYPFTQDKAHNMLCYAYGPRFAFVDESVYLYRSNLESVTFRYKENFIPVWISIATDFHDTLKERGREDSFGDITAFHLFFGSFFIVKQEMTAGNGMKKAIKEIRRYGQNPSVKEAMEGIARGVYSKGISSLQWRIAMRAAAFLFSIHGYALFTLGIYMLRYFHIDGLISDKRNRRGAGKGQCQNATDGLEDTVVALCAALRFALAGEPLGEFEKDCMLKDGAQGLVNMAANHRVLPMIYDILEQYEEQVSPQVMAFARGTAEKTVRQSHRLLFLTRSLVRAFEKEKISVLVLKGCGVSSYYPVPEYRKSGDVDLLLQNMDQVTAAGKILEGLHFTMTEEQHANHHLVYQGPDGIDIELHAMLAEPFDDETLNKKMEELLPQYFVDSRRIHSMGVELPVARDELQALELLLHMLQHFLRSGFGLKLLADWVVFWNHSGREETAKAFQKLAQECGVAGFAKAVTLVCEKYLGLQKGIVFGDGIESSFPKDYAQQFLLEIIEAEEFGKSDKDRMVVLRGHGLQAYVKEFHYQMRMNYPQESKKKWKWPYLWIKTFLVFLRNNRRLGRGSMHSILRNAKKRGSVVEQMRLFHH